MDAEFFFIEDVNKNTPISYITFHFDASNRDYFYIIHGNNKKLLNLLFKTF